MKAAPAIIVIGASEGGIPAIQALTAGLPATLQAAVFIVMHVGAHESQLPMLLNLDGLLLAAHPKNGDPIRAGRIYVAPPDQHLVVEPGHVHLTRGPRENWARPAIDPLFRSAARAYGACCQIAGAEVMNGWGKCRIEARGRSMRLSGSFSRLVL